MELRGVAHEKESANRVIVVLELQEQARDITRKSKFELPNPCVDPVDYPKWFGKSSKKVCIIMSRVLCKSYADRLGSITY